ncbi:hypothetical protein G9A89_003340 [Geosiphon pyriformis]|nr:hypothetical protein G9A89_003340 [Geosiphon pyriformis]
MPEQENNTNAEFDQRYSEKDALKLEPHSHTCINLKIALKILTTTMVQLTSRKKAYIIEPNKKIAQAIFLLLVKIAQLVSVRNREELRITVRKIQGFRSMDKIDVPVNMAEEETIDKGEIISTYHKKPFIITTNASGQALRVVLSQKKLNRQEHPVVYTSKSLSSAEKNYRTPALKHLAIYWAVIK